MSCSTSDILFNPFFCGLIMYSAIDEFNTRTSRGFPFSYSYFILPIVLPSASRNSISRNRSLEAMMNNNPKIAVNFPVMMESCIGYTKNAISCLLKAGMIDISGMEIYAQKCNICVGDRKIIGSDVNRYIDSARIVSRFLSVYTRPEDLYYLMGVRP